MKLEIANPRWTSVIQLQPGCQIVKGRHGVYRDVLNAAGKQTARFGYYAWRTGGAIQYCGSFAQDYKKKEFQTNLEGRVHQYWQNHRVNKNGRLNTNKHVFDKIAKYCKNSYVDLVLLQFDSMEVDKTEFTYLQYTDNPTLVTAVESLLICHYRLLGQCTWNRD